MVRFHILLFLMCTTAGSVWMLAGVAAPVAGQLHHMDFVQDNNGVQVRSYLKQQRDNLALFARREDHIIYTSDVETTHKSSSDRVSVAVCSGGRCESHSCVDGVVGPHNDGRVMLQRQSGSGRGDDRQHGHTAASEERSDSVVTCSACEGSAEGDDGTGSAGDPTPLHSTSHVSAIAATMAAILTMRSSRKISSSSTQTMLLTALLVTALSQPASADSSVIKSAIASALAPTIGSVGGVGSINGDALGIGLLSRAAAMIDGLAGADDVITSFGVDGDSIVDNQQATEAMEVAEEEQTRLLIGKTAPGCSGVHCGLRAWLANLTIVIPDTSVTKDGFDLTIKSLSCHGIDLGGIKSKFNPPFTVELAPSGIGTQCSGDFEAKLHAMKKGYSGSVVVAVGNSGADVVLSVVPGPDGLADKATLDHCELDVKITDIKIIGGITGKILTTLTGWVKGLVTKELGKVACKSVTGLVANNMTDAFQALNTMIEPFLQPQPVHPGPAIKAGSTDLQGNAVVGLVDYVLDEVVGIDGVLNINRVLSALTNGTGKFAMDDLLFNATVAIAGTANLTFGVSSFALSGLDSWTELDALVPTDHHSLYTHTAMKDLAINVTFFIAVDVGDGVVQDSALYEEAQLRLDLGNNRLATQMQIGVQGSDFVGMPVGQLIEPPCILKAFDSVALTQLVVNTTVRNLALVAVGGDLESDLDGAVNTLVSLVTTTYGPAIPALLSGLADGPGLNATNTALEKVLSSPEECKPPAPDDTLKFNVPTSAGGFGLAGGLSIVVLVALWKFDTRRPRILGGHGGRRGAINHEKNAPLISARPSYERGGHCGAEAPCLALHSEIPRILTYTMPVFILATMAMIFSSNTSLGAGLVLKANVAGNVITTPSLFDFTLTNSVRDMWNAGVYPLSLIIAVFSGAWPYLKLLLMLAAWTFPVSIVPVARREGFLMALDALGKWSLIDSYVMTLMLVAFHFVVEIPAVPEAGTTLGSTILNVVVQPGVGFYMFLVATMLSLFMGHIILGCHRYAVDAERRKEIARLERKGKAEQLCKHEFRIGRTLVHCTVLGQAVVALLLVATLVLVIIGVTRESFNFEFKGLAAVALDYLHDVINRPYSVISLGQQIPDCGSNPSDFGLRSIQATFYTFVLAMPLMHLSTMLALWVIPLKPNVTRLVYMCVEVMNAWSAMDVFVISIIVAILELQKFAGFIIGDKCDFLTPYIKTYFDVAVKGDDTCFDVIATLGDGCWIMFAAALTYIVVSMIVMRLCHSVLTERAERAWAMSPLNSPENSANPDLSSPGEGSVSGGAGPGQYIPQVKRSLGLELVPHPNDKRSTSTRTGRVLKFLFHPFVHVHDESELPGIDVLVA